MVRTRMQVEIFNNSSDKHFREKYSHGVFSMIRNINEIKRKEGFFALWKGLPPTLIGIIHPLTFFPIYEKLKIYFKENHDKKSKTLST